mmetsp:Transcript_103610/g.298402  ORF Transcript_103610/g.298402 Transcript_103610/m.298402 type:complete len:299 (+) Transcript_103610:288-1184(+)
MPKYMSTRVTTKQMNATMAPTYQSSQSFLPSMIGAMRRDTMAMSLSRMSRDGPEVSLKGSPTVSPTTQALPCSVFLMPIFSHNFFALSQAPPALPIMMASIAALPMQPANMPMTMRGPMRKPAMSGVKMAYKPGAIISFTELRVEIMTQRSESGSTSSSSESLPSAVTFWMASRSVTPLAFFTSRNCRRTSWIISAAALPTDIMVSAPKKKGSMAPSKVPARRIGSETSKVSGALCVDSSLKAASRESAVSTAEPTAKPLPMAAVVLPRASKASVFARTSGPRPAISARPPALSATGP